MNNFTPHPKGLIRLQVRLHEQVVGMDFNKNTFWISPYKKAYSGYPNKISPISLTSLVKDNCEWTPQPFVQRPSHFNSSKAFIIIANFPFKRKESELIYQNLKSEKLTSFTIIELTLTLIV